jgi:hypothetical protein
MSEGGGFKKDNDGNKIYTIEDAGEPKFTVVVLADCDEVRIYSGTKDSPTRKEELIMRMAREAYTKLLIGEGTLAILLQPPTKLLHVNSDITLLEAKDDDVFQKMESMKINSFTYDTFIGKKFTYIQQGDTGEFWPLTKSQILKNNLGSMGKYDFDEKKRKEMMKKEHIAMANYSILFHAPSYYPGSKNRVDRKNSFIIPDAYDWYDMVSAEKKKKKSARPRAKSPKGPGRVSLKSARYYKRKGKK